MSAWEGSEWQRARASVPAVVSGIQSEQHCTFEKGEYVSKYPKPLDCMSLDECRDEIVSLHKKVVELNETIWRLAAFVTPPTNGNPPSGAPAQVDNRWPYGWSERPWWGITHPEVITTTTTPTWCTTTVTVN